MYHRHEIHIHFFFFYKVLFMSHRSVVCKRTERITIVVPLLNSVSVVQSYFVYWARIESAIVSGHMLRTTSEISEISDMETTSVLGKLIHQVSKHNYIIILE